MGCQTSAEGPPHPGQVGEGLVDRVLLHLGGEAAHDVEHPPGEEAVGLVVGGEDDQPRADPLRLVEGDPPLDPQLFGRVARAGDDSPLASRDERFPLQFRMDHLLAGGEEGVPVDVEDRPRPVVEAENGLIHGASRSEQKTACLFPMSGIIEQSFYCQGVFQNRSRFRKKSASRH